MHINIASISSLTFRLTTQRAKQATGEIEIGARDGDQKYKMLEIEAVCACVDCTQECFLPFV